MKHERLLCFILAITLCRGDKNYNLEKEAKKAYGRNVTQILVRFRRSPDYLKILQRKIAMANDACLDVASLTMSHYRTKLVSRVAAILEYDVNTPLVPFILTSVKSSTSDTPGQPVRDGLNASEVDRLKRVARIDGYPKLSSHLPLQERNEFKNIGYQYAGDCIRAIVENMGESSGYRPTGHDHTSHGQTEEPAVIPTGHLRAPKPLLPFTIGKTPKTVT